MSVHSLSSCCAVRRLHKDAFEGLDNKTTIEKQVERTVFMQLLARLAVVNMPPLCSHFSHLSFSFLFIDMAVTTLSHIVH